MREAAKQKDAKMDHRRKPRSPHVVDISNTPGDLCRLCLVTRLRTARAPLRALRHEAQKAPYLEEWAMDPYSEEPVKAPNPTSLGLEKQSLHAKDAIKFAQDPTAPGSTHFQACPSLLPTNLSPTQERDPRPASAGSNRLVTKTSRRSERQNETQLDDGALKPTCTARARRSLGRSRLQRPATAPLNRHQAAGADVCQDSVLSVKEASTVIEAGCGSGTGVATPDQDNRQDRSREDSGCASQSDMRCLARSPTSTANICRPCTDMMWYPLGPYRPSLPLPAQLCSQ